MKNIGYTHVTVNDGFWKEKQDMVRRTTVDAEYKRFSETHRFDAMLFNWTPESPFTPHVYWDSDIAKWMEGVAYLLRFERDPKWEAVIDAVVDSIEKNRDENGYYNSHYLQIEPENKFSHREYHELYCAGHLVEAAVAYAEATGKRKFLDLMCDYVDYIEKRFKIEQSTPFVTPGHPELELALVKLYKATGEKRYLELSKFFVDMRGNNDKDVNFVPKEQDMIHCEMDALPLREISDPRGHAVRAMYLLAGMTDVALAYGDKELLDACERVYQTTVNRRMYITGGVGSSHNGESFAADYYLPNRTAYAETCASIGLALFSHRMSETNENAGYADTVERALYNNMLSGISMDGDAFFYQNPLEIDLEFNHTNIYHCVKDRFPITRRPQMYNCACCPPNVLRMIASIGGYAYAQNDDTVFINQFIDSTLTIDGTTLTVKTAYPADGKLTITCRSDKQQLAVRIPAWCDTVVTDTPYTAANGYAYFDLHGEDTLSIEFPMEVRVIAANLTVHENAGRVAVTRGPIVYCAESVDNGEDLRCVSIDPDAPFTLGETAFLLPNLQTTGYRPVKTDGLYGKATKERDAFTLNLIPYYAFANREEASMQVWFLQTR